MDFKHLVYGFILIIVTYFYFKGWGGLFYFLTKDGKKLLILSKEIESKLGIKRKFSFLKMLERQENPITHSGSFRGQPITLYLHNYGHDSETFEGLHRRQVRTFTKGMTVITESNGMRRKLSQDEISLREIEQLICSET